MRPCLRNGGTWLSVPAGRLAEVAQGKLGDCLADLEPVAQAGEPGVHAGAAHPIDQCLLEVHSANERSSETDAGQEEFSFCGIKAPQADIASEQAGDAVRVRLDVPRRGLVGRQARVQMAFEQAVAKLSLIHI